MKRNCEGPGCGRAFEAKRSTARYCSGTCRVKASRGEGKAVPKKTAGGAVLVTTSQPVQRLDMTAPRKDWTALDAAHVAGGLPPVDVNAGARQAIFVRVPAVKSLEAPIPRVDNSAAGAALSKVPRKSDEPAAPVISASSILGRMTVKVPSAPVVVPRGSPLLPPSKKKPAKGKEEA